MNDTKQSINAISHSASGNGLNRGSFQNAFCAGCGLAKERPLHAGIEMEMPILNLHKEAVDFAVVHKVAEQFIGQFGFEVEKRDDDGEIVLAEDPALDMLRELNEGGGY